MSADNWTYCPKCRAEHDTALKKEQKRVADLYGKVDVAAFDAARAALKTLEDATPEQTLREDYEIGIYNGVFSINYGAGCECGFRYEFKHEVPVALSPDPPKETL